MSLDEQIKGKSKEDRIKLKSSAIVKHLKKGKEKTKGLNIEIVDFQEIEGGVQVLVRAFRGKKQIGFGKDGTVDIERFRIFNPPVLVDDPNGDIMRVTEANEELGVPRSERRLREDPEKAIIESLAHTIEQVGKEGKIQKGKVGNTTSTFYSAGGANSPVDGHVFTAVSNEPWATLRARASGQSVTSTATTARILSVTRTSGYSFLGRGFTLFDTSPIGGDTIISTNLSLYGSSKSTMHGVTDSRADMVITTSSPASNSNLVLADYNIANFGSSALARMSISSFSTSAYNQFTLDNSVVDTSGITKLGQRLGCDIDNNPLPQTGASDTITEMYFFTADQAGTANDPKLVVEHEAPAVDTSKFFMFF